MKIKMKALSWWQGLLIAIGGIILAIGGVFLYVYLTTGIGPQKIYPEDVSFDISEEASEKYNQELGQFEVSNDFSLKIKTGTENVTQGKLTLSFTNNFTETAVDGYITNGVITIPQIVEIGQDFDVKVVKNEGWNVGGISTIYAMTENKLLLPTSAKIAVDVPVKQISVKISDTSSDRVFEENNKVFNIIKDTRVQVEALFTPENSEYIFSDNKVGGDNIRKKQYFIEVLEGSDNFVMNRDSSGVYFTASGDLDSTAKIKIYTFKNSQDQLDFYNSDSIKALQGTEGGEENIYINAITELSSSSDKACVVTADIKIVEATVSEFKISRTQEMNLTSDVKYTLRANSNEYSEYVLGTTILDDLKESVPAMISKIALRVLKQDSEKNWVETDEVKVIGGDTVEYAEDAHYTLINSDIRDLNNAYWELSSSVEKGSYKLEIVLLVTKDKNYEIFNDQKYELILTFNEATDASVSWGVDDKTLNMIVFPGEDQQSTQYSKKLSEMISIPAKNVYQKVVYFAYHEEWKSAEDAKKYLDILSYKKYKLQNDEAYMAELDSPYLLVKKGIENLKIRFATVKTDAYGKVLLTKDQAGNDIYQIVQWSDELTINTLEEITGLDEEKMQILDTNFNSVDDGKDNKKYVVKKDQEVSFQIAGLDENKVALFKKQYNQNLITITAVDSETNIEIGDKIKEIKFEEETFNGEPIIKFSVKFQDSIVSGNADRLVFFRIYYTPTQDISRHYDIKCLTDNRDENIYPYFTVYESNPAKIILPEGLAEEYTVSAIQEGDEWVTTIKDTDGNPIDLADINSALGDVKVEDRYGIDITTIAGYEVTTDNSSIIKIGEDKKISFNSIGEDTPNVTVIVSSANQSESIKFSFTTAKVKKIDYLKDTEDNRKTDNIVSDDNKATEIKNLTSVTIYKNGAMGNEITLSKLIKVYTGIDNDVKGYNGSLKFKLRNIAGIGDNAKYLYGSEGMLELYKDMKKLEDISEETEIDSITVQKDFYGDYNLELRVIGVGVSIDLNIVFVNNVEEESSGMPTTYQQGQNTVKKPEDFTNGSNTFIGVYADYEIDLNDLFKIKKLNSSSNYIDWASGHGISTQSGVTYAAGKITFDQVYEPKMVTFTLYEYLGNDFGYNKQIRCYVYPNIQSKVEKTTLFYTDVASSGGAQNISNYFTLQKYVYTDDAKLELNVDYETSQKSKVTINDGQFKRAENAILNLISSRGTEEAFEVNVKKDGAIIKDYNDKDISISMSLSLRDAYELIIKANSSYMSKVVYGGKELVLFKQTSEDKKTLAPTDSDSDSKKITLEGESERDLGNYSFDVDGTINTNIINNETTGYSVRFSNIIETGDKFYIPIEMKIDSVTVAKFAIPIVATKVDSIFAYYKNYNEYDNNTSYTFDLKTLLSTTENLSAFPQDVFMELDAGKNYNIFKDQAILKENIYYVEDSATLVNDVRYNDDKKYSSEGTNSIPKDTVVKIVKKDSNTYTITYTQGEGSTLTEITITGVPGTDLDITYKYSETSTTYSIQAGLKVDFELTSVGVYKITYSSESEDKIVITNVPVEKLTFEEGIYNPKQSSKGVELAFVEEQILVKLSANQISGRNPGENITLKLGDVYSTWNKITLGTTTYTWSIKDGLLILTDGSTEYTEADSKIVVNGIQYDISYYALQTAQTTSLIEKDNNNKIQDPEKLEIKDLANEDRFVVLKVKFSIEGSSIEYIYRIKVNHNLNINKNYPYGGNEEYLGVEGSLTKDLSTVENGTTRFNITDNNGKAKTDVNFTNSIKSLTIDGREYSFDEGSIYKLKLEETAEKRIYTAGGYVVIEFVGDSMTINIIGSETKFEFVMTKEYEGVVNGELEYKFIVNASDKKYAINFNKATISHNGSIEKDLNPSGEQTFTALTVNLTASTETVVGDNVETSISVNKGSDNWTLTKDSSENTYNLKKDGSDIATIVYDPKSTEDNLTITPNEDFTFSEETTFDLIFAVKEFEDGQVVVNQAGIATISFIIGRKIKITGSETAFSGGKTYSFSDLIGSVQKYGTSGYEDAVFEKIAKDTVTSTISDSYLGSANEFVVGGKTILIKDLPSDAITEGKLNKDIYYAKLDISTDDTIRAQYVADAYIKIEVTSPENCNFISIDKDNQTITTAMLNEMKKVEFKVTITDTSVGENATYEFTINKDIAKSVTYVDGKNLADSKDKAYIYNVTSQSVVAGNTIAIPFNSFISSLAVSGGSFSLENYNGSDNEVKICNCATCACSECDCKDCDCTDCACQNCACSSGGENARLIIKPRDVATNQTISYSIELKYTFGTGNNAFSFTFYVNINLSVTPNTVATVNYPNISNTQLDYETVKAGDSGNTFNWDFFNSKNPLAEGNRVVFTQANGNAYSSINSSDVTITATKLSDVEEVKCTCKTSGTTTCSCKTNNSLTCTCTSFPSSDCDCPTCKNTSPLYKLASGKTTGTIIFTVKYKEVSAEYEIYLTAGEVYTIKQNYTIGAEDDVDLINRDSLQDQKLFEDNRLIALTLPTNIDSALNGSVVTVKFNGDKTVKFLLDTNKRGMTIYIEPGVQVSSIGTVTVGVGDTGCNKTWNARATARITVYYTTKTGELEIQRDKIKGTVTEEKLSGGTTASQPNSNVSFNEYSIQAQNVNIGYTITYTLKISDCKCTTNNSSTCASCTSNSVDVVTSGTYKFKQALDIDVKNTYDNNTFISLTAHEQDDDARNLVKIAEIYHPTTGLPMTADDVANGVEVKLEIIRSWSDESVSSDASTIQNGLIYQNHKDDIDATFAKLGDNANLKFLSYTDIKVLGESSQKTWNYLLYGEGATNNGSWALIKFSYTAKGATQSFYIWVRILPDYKVNVNNESITLIQGEDTSTSQETYSISNNSDKPYELEPIEGDKAYSMVLTSTSSEGNPIVKIVNSATGSGEDKAPNWTYTIRPDDEENGVLYNTDLDKVKNNDNVILAYKVKPTTGSPTDWIWNVPADKISDTATANGAINYKNTAESNQPAKYEYTTETTGTGIQSIASGTSLTIEATSSGTYTIKYKPSSGSEITIYNVPVDKVFKNKAKEEIKYKDNGANASPRYVYDENGTSSISSDAGVEIENQSITLSKNNSNTINLSKDEANIFGKKNYKIVATNEFGYTAEIYITFVSKNTSDPSIHSSSNLSAITEGEYFDIGAVYQELKLTKDNDAFALSASEAYPSDDSVKYVNIAGIDTWAFTGTDLVKENGFTATTGAFDTVFGENKEGEKYLENEKDILKYVSVSSIEFLYTNSDTGTVSSVGNVTLLSEKILATKEGLYELTSKQITITVSESDQSKIPDSLSKIDGTSKTTADIKVTKDSNDTYSFDNNNGQITIPSGSDVTVSVSSEGTPTTYTYTFSVYDVSVNNKKPNRDLANNKFQVPLLEDWIYSTATNANKSEDTAQVRMRITLTYDNGEENGDHLSESFTLLTDNITVTKLVKTDKTAQAVVRDGEAFNLANGSATDGYYFSSSAASEDASVNNITYIDDTIAITLPATITSAQYINVGIEVKDSSGTEKATGSFSLSNTGTYEKTYYTSISKNLRTSSGAGYLIKTDDKIKFTFTGYENNGEIISGNKRYQKFYATYGYQGETQNVWTYGVVEEDPNKGVAPQSASNSYTIVLPKTIAYDEEEPYQSGLGVIPKGSTITSSDNTYKYGDITLSVTQGETPPIENNKATSNIYYITSTSNGTTTYTYTENVINAGSVVTYTTTANNAASISYTNNSIITTVSGIPVTEFLSTTYKTNKELYYGNDNKYSSIGGTRIQVGTIVTLSSANNSTCTINYTNDEEESVSVTDVPLSLLSYTSVTGEITVATQTQDKICIPTYSEFRSQIPEVTKSYIMNVNVKLDSSDNSGQDRSYRVEKKWIVTPYYYKATSGLNEGLVVDKEANVIGKYLLKDTIYYANGKYSESQTENFISAKTAVEFIGNEYTIKVEDKIITGVPESVLDSENKKTKAIIYYNDSNEYIGTCSKLSEGTEVTYTEGTIQYTIEENQVITINNVSNNQVELIEGNKYKLKNDIYYVESTWIQTSNVVLEKTALSEVTIGSTCTIKYGEITINGVPTANLDTKYFVDFETWSTEIKYAQGYGNNNPPSHKQTEDSKLENASKLNIMVGKRNEDESGSTIGTAIVDEGGNVTTRSEYPINGDEYIQLIIRVRASGVDGTFSNSNDNDYLLGNLRIFVKSSSNSNTSSNASE